MLFKQLKIEASKRMAKEYDPPFRWLVHHVAEVFMEMLPQPFALDGSSKVQITCGPTLDASEAQYERKLGVSSYLCEGFAFEEFYRATPDSRDNITLKLIESSLTDIAARCGATPQIRHTLTQTVDAVRGAGFNLKRRVTKLCRRTPCRKLQVEIYRCLNREAGESWLCEVVDLKGVVVHAVWMSKSPDYLDRRDFFKKSEWSGETFRVQTNLGYLAFELDLQPLLRLL